MPVSARSGPPRRANLASRRFRVEAKVSGVSAARRVPKRGSERGASDWRRPLRYGSGARRRPAYALRIVAGCFALAGARRARPDIKGASLGWRQLADCSPLLENIPMRTEEHDVRAYVESEHGSDSHGGANRAEPPPLESSRMDSRQFADLRPRSPMQSRWSRQNGGNQEPSTSATHAWVASQREQPMPRVISPVSTLRSVSPPPGRPHVQPAPSHALPLHAPTPVHPPRPHVG